MEHKAQWPKTNHTAKNASTRCTLKPLHIPNDTRPAYAPVPCFAPMHTPMHTAASATVSQLQRRSAQQQGVVRQGVQGTPTSAGVPAGGPGPCEGP